MGKATDSVVPSALRHDLCDFIRTHRAEILRSWEQTVRALPIASTLPQHRLIDHLPDVLDHVAVLVCVGDTGDQTPAERESPQVHALERLDSGFDVGVVATEYAMLRECVLSPYGASRDSSVPVAEVQRFNIAIDGAIVVAMEHYARARERTLSGLDRISTAALQSNDAEQFLPKLLAVLMQTTEAVDSVAVFVRDGDLLRLRAAVGIMEEDLGQGYALKLGQGFTGTVALRKQPVELRSAATDPLVINASLRAKGTRALYGVPMMEGSELIGVAHMGSRTAFQFSEEDKLFFRAMTTRATALFVQTELTQREREARAEVELRTAELQAILDHAPAAIYVKDLEGRYTVAGRRLEEIFGRRDVVGKTDHELLDSDSADELRAVDQLIWKTGQPVRKEEQVPAADGAHTYLSIKYLIPGPDGKPTALGGISTDVTDMKNAEAELRRTAAFREQFIGVLGHDLRNPLSAIKSSADLLLRQEDLKPAHARAVRRIAGSTERMARMISDVLDFTRGRLGGGIPVELRPADLGEVCQQVVDELHLGHPDSIIDLTIVGDCRGLWDPDRAAQVISNVIGNALQHGAAEQPVRVALTAEGEGIRMRVTNQGQPIPEALLPSIFEPFTGMAVASGRGGKKSLGLGLWIVHEIVRAHHGDVSVTSSEDAGTTFDVWWPRRRVNGNRDTADRASPGASP